MSNEDFKIKHSKRLLKEENAINKQLKIAKAQGNTKYVKQPHRLAKHHAADCGVPGCVMCANPRRTWKERTIQEESFDQTKEWE
jgi:hypothetical protein